ncbi:SAG family member [Eimeria brunetti]|uniref:SAG family member n=1 Tax=Eimeria brunetti TaxID=51314 RepID=U6LM26_9EIME|nr:SAG family member [Eimeria brunetti]
MAVLKLLAVAVAAIFISENDSAFGATPPNGEGSENGGQGSSGPSQVSPGGNGSGPEDENHSGADAEDGGGETDTGTNSAAREDCWKQMNEARSLVGFTGFQQQDMLKITVAEAKAASGTAEEVKQYLKQVCDAVKTNTAPTDLTSTVDGTFAYAVQEGEKADCQAAVDYWKEAFTNFNGELPPAYEANTKPYDDPRNISFISLFNPKESPKVDCAYFTCPKAAAGDGTQRQTAGTEGAVKALICVTTPNALTKDKKPYEQEQWDKIAAGLKSGSAAAATPAALALAAAAVASLIL